MFCSSNAKASECKQLTTVLKPGDLLNKLKIHLTKHPEKALSVALITGAWALILRKFMHVPVCVRRLLQGYRCASTSLHISTIWEPDTVYMDIY